MRVTMFQIRLRCAMARTGHSAPVFSARLKELMGLTQSTIKLECHPRRKWRQSAVIWLLLAVGCAMGQAPARPVTPIADIRALNREQASRKAPVRVRGVVQWVGGRPQDDFILADDSAAIYAVRLPPFDQENAVNSGGGLLVLHPGLEHIGMEVELEGFTNSGGFTPIIQYRRVNLLGKGRPLPVRQVTIDHLNGGSEDGQRIELETVVVQSVIRNPEHDKRLLRVCGASGDYTILEVSPAAWNEPARIIDAEVRVRGNVLALTSSRSEQTGVRVAVSLAEDFVIVKPPPPDPFAAPKVEVGALTPFRPQGLSPHRCQVEGTVTLVSPDELVIQDGERGVGVKLTPSTGLKVGDRVLLSGFVEARTPVAYLTNALVKRLSAGVPPAPASTTVETILEFGQGNTFRFWGKQPVDFNHRLVRLRGTLIGKLNPGAESFTLQSDTGINVTFRFATASPGISRMPEEGSRVELTGVGIVNYVPGTHLPELIHPAGVEMLLRGPEDIRLLEAPSWWTARRLGIALGAVAAVLAIASAWVVLLRRTVKQQALRIETALRTHRNAELEHRAAKRERMRLSGDLHDGVHQLLNAAFYRLESVANLCVRDPAAALPHVQAAQKILNHSQHEMRALMWGLYELSQDSADFVELLTQALAGMDHWPSGVVEVADSGTPRTVPARAAGSLLLLVQEAVQNALSHGHATRIQVQVEFTTDALRLAIQDNGSGFDPAQPHPTPHGGLGIGSMRRRVDELEGAFTLTSAPGQGVALVVVLPWAAMHRLFPSSSPAPTAP